MGVRTGSRLGAYEILAPLGAGGMGEVYRARDCKLGRDVALKTLPDTFIHDPERLLRFRREAQVLATLNHQNIAQIHGLEEADGTQFLVLEFVDGESLDKRIARGPLPVDEALAIAKQITEALEAAHEKGIIHRDLKPANIALTAAHQVKVLDFGLAKATESAVGASVGLTNSPTITSPAVTTGAGVLLGTAAYMPPEQANGKSIDPRADIWSFGAVLYEMLASRKAFEGESVSDTLASVLKVAPDWNALPAATPRAIRRLVRRCLTKDRTQRLQAIGEARIVLESPAAEETAPAAPSRSTFGWIAAAAMTVVTLALGWIAWSATRPVEHPLFRLDLDLGPDVSLTAPTLSGGHTILISPDGSRLLYAANILGSRPPILFTRRLDQTQAAELTGADQATMPFFSPDGRWVGFRSRSMLNKMPVDGGLVVPLGEIGAAFGGASWGQDGSIIIGGRGLMRIPESGGTPTSVTELAGGEFAHINPSILPGGKAVLFNATRSLAVAGLNVDTASLEVVSMRDRQRKMLVRGGIGGRYVLSGHLVYGNQGTVFAIPFDLDRLETRGAAVPVVDGVAYGAQSGLLEFDVSNTGTLIYRKGGREGANQLSTLTLNWLEASGKTTALRDKPGDYEWPSFSPDGTRLALNVRIEQVNRDIWIYEWQRDTMTRLTLGGNYGAPTWSPDGRYVVFSGAGAGGLFWTRADGAGQPQPLTMSRSFQVSPSFTPDGKRLAFAEPASGTLNIWTVAVEDSNGQLRAGPPEQLVAVPLGREVATLTISPDGRWLAYQSTESGSTEVYVRPFSTKASGPAGRWQISNAGGVFPIWSRASHDLFYESGDQIMAVSYTVNGDAFVADKPRIWAAKLKGRVFGRRFDLSPDGKRLAVLTPVATTGAPTVDHEVAIVLNFRDELRRRVPVGK